jgi:uncharacterized protein (DUF1697 family)
MTRYVVLLRGINVGGKNKIAMARLTSALEGEGFTDVRTYLQSGNVLLTSPLAAKAVGTKIEELLTTGFTFDSELIKVLALSRAQFLSVVDNRPKGFGDEPGTYHSDAIFLMDIPVKAAMETFSPRDGVDAIWPGKGVVYSRRLSAERTRSRLNRIMQSPLYKSMTIRSWQTVVKLAEALG